MSKFLSFLVALSMSTSLFADVIKLVAPPQIECRLVAYQRGEKGVAVSGTTETKTMQVVLGTSIVETLRGFKFRINLSRHTSTVQGSHNVFHLYGDLLHGDIEALGSASSITPEPTDKIINAILFNHLRVVDEMAMITCNRVVN